MAWVNYKQLREELSIEDVIAHYGIPLTGSGSQRKCVCPFDGCDSDGKQSLSVNLDKNLWKCWSCDTHGNVIDLVARCEGLNPLDTKEFRKAALLMQERHGIKAEKPEQESGKRRSRKKSASSSSGSSGGGRSKKARRKRVINEPLDFTLKGLDPAHESVEVLGLSQETIEYFEIGYCVGRGMFKGRVTAPLKNEVGQLVGYTGRLADEAAVSSENPLWLLPDQERIRQKDNAVLVFDLSRLLYHADQIEEPVPDLIVVDTTDLVWRLFDKGVEAVVGILKGVSVEQTKQIVDRVAPDGTAWFLSYAGKPVEAMIHVARERKVRWLVTDESTDLDDHIQSVMG